MKNLLSKLGIFKPKPVESPTPEPDVDDDFEDVVNNNFGILQTRDKECFDLDEKIYFSSKIELNRHNNNFFEQKFYTLLFDAELYNIKLIVIAKYDEIKDSKHEHDILQARTIHVQANEIFEREKKKFMLYAMEHFKDETILMIKSMKAKNIVAVALEDIDLYFQTEWQTRKTKSYPTIISKLKLIEVVIMEEYKNLKIIPDTPPADDFLSEFNATSSKGTSTISFK